MKKPIIKQEYAQKEKRVGRPIRLNKVELMPIKGKDYAELIFWGDVHLGHPQCQIEKAKAMLDYAIKRGAYVIGMGDYLESGTRESVGDSVYQQKLNPQEQMEQMIEILRPVAEAGLLIGLLEGNHENRITKMTSINVTKIMANMLGVPYLGYACWNLLRVGKMHYSLYANHGSSGSRFKHTKLKAAIDIAHWIDADIIAMAHVHSLVAESIIKQSVSLKTKTVVEKKCYVVITGSYIAWDKSYAQMKNMPITKIGSPKAKLNAKKKDVHFSL